MSARCDRPLYLSLSRPANLYGNSPNLFYVFARVFFLFSYWILCIAAAAAESMMEACDATAGDKVNKRTREREGARREEIEPTLRTCADDHRGNFKIN